MPLDDGLEACRIIEPALPRRLPWQRRVMDEDDADQTRRFGTIETRMPTARAASHRLCRPAAMNGARGNAEFTPMSATGPTWRTNGNRPRADGATLLPLRAGRHVRLPTVEAGRSVHDARYRCHDFPEPL